MLSSKDLERRLTVLQATWDYFHDMSTRVSEELRPGPRGGGRTRDEIVRHVYASERHNFWRKVGIRHEDGVRLTPDELAALRVEYVDTIRSYNAEGKAARLQATSQADYGPTSDNEFAKALHSGAMQVVWDRPDNMAAREALFGRAAAILTGQSR